MNADSCEYTIVLPDCDILSRVCGTNDSNLRLIEHHLGIPVFSRGNELSINQESSALRQEFQFIIDRLVDELSENKNAGSELVESVLNTEVYNRSLGSDTESFNSSEYSVLIPGSSKKIYPKTKNQARLISALRKNDLVFAEGASGSGKTLLCVAESLSLLMKRKVKSLILTRPVVEAGESLGFLPGDLRDKINPYLRPLFDAVDYCLPRDTVKKLFENGIIEVSPLAYMRGRTLNNAAVILDEAQNTTNEQMKMFLTRIGDGTKVFVTGDTTQTDLKSRGKSGLEKALSLLSGIEGIGIVKLDGRDIVRSALVKKIVKAYEYDETE